MKNSNNSFTCSLFCGELTSTQVLNPGTMMSSDKMNDADTKKKQGSQTNTIVLCTITSLLIAIILPFRMHRTNVLSLNCNYNKNSC